MSENKHTQEPWIAGDAEDSDYFLVGPHDGDGIVYQPVVTLHSEANARRIVACVNACAGLPTEMLEEGGIPSIAQHMKLEKQRNELQEEVNALKERAEYDLAEFARTLDISYDEIKLLKKQRDELLAALEAGRRLIELISPFEVDVTRQMDKAIAASKSNAA